MAKRTAKELWDALDEVTLDAEIESALAMTREERRRALLEEGYDIGALHAQADVFFASLRPEVAAAASPVATPEEPSEPIQALVPVVSLRARKAWTSWLAAVAAIAVVTGFGIDAALTPLVGHRPPPGDSAASLRDAAQIDCDAKRWDACRQGLNRAARADREGEGEPRVVKMREAIAAGVVAGSGDAH